MSRIHNAWFAGLIPIGLTLLFWWPLWRGGGIVGGDVYSYYLPQKVFFAEQIEQGNLPAWNPRTGHGYPFVGESQTGVFYPAHLLAYRFLDVNTAYNVNHLLHYVLAFAFAWLLAGRLGLKRGPAALAALIYAYAWFPPRTCWEWAILGGAWMPAALWCVERFLATSRWRFGIGLCFVLALQMLAGHFNISFLTLLILAVYIPARIFVVIPASEPPPEWAAPGRTRDRLRGKLTQVAVLGGAVALSFALAAVQLAPTWKLKELSQRSEGSAAHQVEAGSIPPRFLLQVLGWRISEDGALQHWYAPDVNRDAELNRYEDSLGAPTNQIEAQLYFGLIPLGLAALGVVSALRRRRGVMILWSLIGTGAALYTTGRFVPLVDSLPGFSFFQGPGRYGLIASLAAALLAGFGLQTLLERGAAALKTLAALVVLAAALSVAGLVGDTQDIVARAGAPHPLRWGGVEITLGIASGIAGLLSAAFLTGLWLLGPGPKARDRRDGGEVRAGGLGAFLLAASCCAITACDLWLVSRLVTYSPLVMDPPIRYLDESPLRRILAEAEGQPRLFAPGGNLPTVLGVAATPPYFTFGPQEYTDSELTMPEGPAPVQARWLQRAGVTHVLRFEPLDQDVWPVRLIWTGLDPVLNNAWARYREPLFLYELAGSRGRVALAERRDADSGNTDSGNKETGNTATGNGAADASQDADNQDAGRRENAVDGQPAEGPAEAPADGPPADEESGPRVRLVSYHPERVVVATRSTGKAKLVLTDLMYPGWTVRVDGEPAQAIRDDGMFRAVELSPGRHTVEWTYESFALYWGSWVSIITLIALAGIAHVRFWHTPIR